MKETPLVTVIIPVYNAMPYFKEALSSITGQTYANLQILVIDDCSTDGSFEYATERAQQDSRITVLSSPPKKKGERRTAGAINRGIEAADGTFIALMDADDRSAPMRIEQQVAFMQQHPGLIATGTQSNVQREERMILRSTKARLPLKNEELQLFLLAWSPFFQYTVMMRREVIRKHNLRYDESMQHAEDFEFFSRLLKVGAVANLDSFLVTHRLHRQQSTAQPEFKAYVKRVVIRNFKEMFAINDQEAEQHWRFVNHRDGYKPADFPQWESWTKRLITLNEHHRKTSSRYMQAFVTEVITKRLLSNKTYTPGLLLRILSEPVKVYWNRIPVSRKITFILKCFMFRKQ